MWYWCPKPPAPNRKGLRCRVLAYGRLNSALVELEDGTRVVTDRRAVRSVAR